MPDDYIPISRSLSLSSTHADNSLRPSWPNPTLPVKDTASFRDQLINRVARISRGIKKKWASLSLWQKVGSVFASIMATALGVTLMVLTSKVFVWLAPLVETWEESKLVYLVFWLCVVLVSFPPLIGWSTLGTVAGYLFGIWKGWLLYTTASIVGSMCSFVVSRTILSKFVNRLMERDKRFAALSLTLKYDGLKLLCMIRLCPLPYSICNGAVSTFPTVQPLMYGLATAIISPKMLVPVFVGSRIRLLSDVNDHMSPGSKAINIISIIVTAGIGVFTGWYIYKRTMSRARELEVKEREGRQRASADDVTAALMDEEARVGLENDEDNLDLDVESSDAEADQTKPVPEGLYVDDFTDNESDIFKGQSGVGTTGEAYGLHTYIDRRGSQAI